MAPTLPSSVRVIVRGGLNSNTAVLRARGENVAIDSGYCTHREETLALLAGPGGLEGEPLERLINTHCHSDHMGGNAAIASAYGCRITIPEGEVKHVDPWTPQSVWMAQFDQRADPFHFDDTIAAGDTFEAGGFTWEAHGTPGHDMDALVYFEPANRILVSGDALWENGMGFVWPEQGANPAIAAAHEALDTIARLDPQVVIPGHGAPFSAVGDAIAAAREATDALLRQLGKQPHAAAGDAAPALEELLQRSGAAMLADQLDQARALIQAAPAALRATPRVEHRMAQIELRSGEYEAAETRMHALVDRLPPGRDDALRARAMLTLAAAQVRRNHAELAADLYDEAIALRSNAADHEVLGVARLGRGALLATQGRYDEATAELSQARTELATIGDGLGVASVDVNLGEFQRMRHRPADALAVLGGAVRQFERLGAREGRAYALMQQVLAESELLEVDAAFATSERFWPPEANTNNRRMRWQLTRVRALALVGVGRVADARSLLAQIDRDADPQRDASTRAAAASLAATVELRAGDLVAAASRIERARVPALRESDPIEWTRALVLHARIQRARGAVADAAATAALLQAEAVGDEWRTMQAAVAVAEQAWAEHRREPALERFAQAMQAAERLGVPDDLVAVGAAYVEALVEASQLDSARAVSGRIALWADRDVRAAGAQSRLFRALGQDDAARGAEENEARLLAGYADLVGARPR
ncbi:MAG TPA: MBL fold metallo-hydrolase [Dokdonella sp.]|nr:MBL fold metallo-hydrolase [Dokdonella sp.]